MSDWDSGIPEELRNIVTQGDARELARRLPDKCIGVIITSPPYNVGLRYEEFNDNLDHDKFVEFNYYWLAEAYRISKDGCRLYAVIDDDMLFWFRDVAEKTGWKYAQTLVWCKPNLAGKNGKKISEDWNYMTEFILLFRKGKRTPMQSGISTTHNWFVETTPQSNFKVGRFHPAQWPTNLPLRILSRTPGEPVLDLFAGSGEAMIAAKMLGRNYIGFEIVEKYVRIANKRIRQTQPPLFKPEHTQLDLMATEECDEFLG